MIPLGNWCCCCFFVTFVKQKEEEEKNIELTQPNNNKNRFKT